MKKRVSLLSKLAMLAATLIWGSSFFMMKDAVNAIPVSVVLAFRFSVGFILLSVIFPKKYRFFNKSYLIGGAVTGLFLSGAYFAQSFGLTDPVTTPGKNAFLTAIYCVLVPFIHWIFSKKKPNVFNLASAFVCIIGIWCIAFDGNFAISYGDALTLLGGTIYAFHIVIVARFAESKDMIFLTTLQFGFAALYSWIVAICQGEYAILGYFTKETTPSLLYLAVMCTAVALLFQNIAEKHVAPAPASIILSLESVFGVLFSLVFGYESITLKIGIGFVLVFAAVLVSEALPVLFVKKEKGNTADNI